MHITPYRRTSAPWLFFMFHLPTRRASERVRVWRKLQKYGALAWKNSAYVLPHSASSLEKLQWLAAEVRKYRGEASVVEVSRIEGHAYKQIVALFNEARARDYDALIRDIRFAQRPLVRRGWARKNALAALSRRLAEIAATDEFDCPRRKEAEALLRELKDRTRRAPAESIGFESKTLERFHGRAWMTRPRPEVDRVGSAWLIKRFIDPDARFIFAADPRDHPGALRFDMFEGEFTHVGEDCTFEVLVKRFDLPDDGLRLIGQMIHDADLQDEKFGRTGCHALDLVFKGWGKSGWSDEDILKQGFTLYDGLYSAVRRRSAGPGSSGRLQGEAPRGREPAGKGGGQR